MKISVVLPAYNEERTMGEVVKEIYTVLDREVEVVVVDDGSTDNTAKVAKEAGAKVIRNPYNMGNGAAIKRGLRVASYPIVVLMDADGQHLPSQILKLVEKIDDFDMVIGERKGKQNWLRHLANRVYNLLGSYVSGIKIKDLTSGFRVVKKDKVMNFLYLLPNTFSYPATLTLSFIKAAYPIAFVPVEISPRKRGKSKINLFVDGIRFFIIIIKISIFFSPLKIFLPVSILFFILGSLYYLYTFINYHRFTNMSMLLFTTSVIIFMLGLISEQIAHLRMERIEDSC
ncbi:MAG: glycosyltransferase family 2 protein [Candidatus Omnitrophica bacterium]|nr:glycosyltransferase family 2 protein [Candidatus Omnitrophota bacterium]MCM8823194.1 glycosyltransferase family 2 protein [Candidatus Omnitrophota bacterium]MCM8826518.1 glycosyltransferase family 2 protein [Candidatus Omnitrophota bacterium]